MEVTPVEISTSHTYFAFKTGKNIFKNACKRLTFVKKSGKKAKNYLDFWKERNLSDVPEPNRRGGGRGIEICGSPKRIFQRFSKVPKNFYQKLVII